VNKLWLRLVLAFGLVTIAAILIAAALANSQVNVQFRRFVGRDQTSNFVAPLLADYYARNGSWAGIETFLREPPGPIRRRMGAGMRFGPPRFVLADAGGRVVYNGTGPRQAGQIDAQEIAEAIPVEWQDQTVGYLVIGPSNQVDLTGPALAFLAQLNRALLQAGLVASCLGVLAGVIIARSLSAPLSRLAGAARRIAQGDFEQQVPVTGTAELADLARAFNEMGANLQQAETLRRNLVADIAHELRTPLSVIQGNLRAILDDVYPLEKAEIAAIFDETIILSRLINDLRQLAQAEAGQLSLNLQPTDLAALINRAVDRFAEPAREQQIELGANLPPELPLVTADPDRVRQGLHNLLANALRHTPPGGKITVSAAGQDSLPPAFVRISVTDTGAGIPPSDLPHIFDRFWRADPSRDREHGGSGLGLAIAKQLVEAHGGQIGVESEGTPGRGSCFWFTLPQVA
jgi:two-component system OmpR family sensor kinase/two-component system sensor histidine kinase BaeS